MVGMDILTNCSSFFCGFISTLEFLIPFCVFVSFSRLQFVKEIQKIIKACSKRITLSFFICLVFKKWVVKKEEFRTPMSQVWKKKDEAKVLFG